jgi:hypothetical protein
MESYRTLRYLALFIAAVLAVAPFFHSVSSSVDSAGTLSVKLDERGLGGTNVSYTLIASADATFICCNKGGNQPAASNKVTTAAIGAETALPVPKNGRIVVTLTAGPPETPDFCPAGQREVVANVKYVSMTLIDTINSVTAFPEDAVLPGGPKTC